MNKLQQNIWTTFRVALSSWSGFVGLRGRGWGVNGYSHFPTITYPTCESVGAVGQLQNREMFAFYAACVNRLWFDRVLRTLETVADVAHTWLWMSVNITSRDGDGHCVFGRFECWLPLPWTSYRWMSCLWLHLNFSVFCGTCLQSLN